MFSLPDYLNHTKQKAPKLRSDVGNRSGPLKGKRILKDVIDQLNIYTVQINTTNQKSLRNPPNHNNTFPKIQKFWNK